MDISLENVAKIKTANLKIDEITVLTGLNGMGKSTTCKSIYMLLNVYSNLNAKILEEKRRSIYLTIRKMLEEVRLNNVEDDIYILASKLTSQIEKTWMQPSNLADKTSYRATIEDFFKETKVTWETEQIELLNGRISDIIEKAQEDYLDYFISRAITTIFKDQISYINNPELQTTVQIDFGKEAISVIARNNEVIQYSTKLPNGVNVPVYLEPRNILDDVHEKFFYRGNRNTSNISQFLMKEVEEQEVSVEEFEKRKTNAKKVKEILSEVTQGKLVNNPASGMTYSEVGMKGEIICTNVASGLKIFLIIQRLVENGLIDSNRLLIIDEPEINLHPKWQVMLAQVLVLLNEELGVKILVSTHSPYFLRAIEVYVNDNNRKGKVNYYTMKEVENGLRYSLEEVTNNLEKVYQEMYYPLEELS